MNIDILHCIIGFFDDLEKSERENIKHIIEISLNNFQREMGFPIDDVLYGDDKTINKENNLDIFLKHFTISMRNNDFYMKNQDKLRKAADKFESIKLNLKEQFIFQSICR